MAVAAVVLVAAAPAWAQTSISINPGNVPTTAEGHDTHECNPDQGGGPFPGQDVWVFVLPGNQATTGDFQSVTATFVEGTVTITRDDDPDNFSPEGGPATSKAWVVTPAGWTLTGATAEISGSADFFNLTHTCPGGPGPTPTPTVPTPTQPVPTVPVPSGPPETGGGGSIGEGTVLPGLAGLALAGLIGSGLLIRWRRGVA